MKLPTPKDARQMAAKAPPSLRWAARKAQSIWFPVITLVFFAVILPTATAGWFATDQFATLSREKAAQDLKTLATARRDKVDLWLSVPLQGVQAVNSSILLREVLKILERGKGDPGYAKARGDLDRFFSYLREGKPALRGLALLDNQGTMVHQHPANSFAGVSAVVLPPDLGDQARLISVQERSRSALVILQGVEGSKGASTGVVAALLNLDPLRQILDEGGSSGTWSYLVDHAGNRVLGGGTGALDPTGPGFRDILHGVTAADFTGVRGTPAVGMALALRGAPWTLVLEVPREEAFGAVDRFRTRMVWLVLGFTALLLIPGLLLARAIVRPLGAMSRTARRIVGGKLGEQVVTRGWGEMKELLEAFNTMSRSLYQSMEALRASNEEFRRLSITDPLTGRHNRRYMLDTLARDLKQAKRFSLPLSVVMVDIDRFKNFNDKHGHLAGDEALKGISGVLAVNIRDSDVVARWGGEEFLVSLVQTDKPGGINAAEKLREAVEGLTFNFKGKKARLTISCGVATFEEDGRTLEELLEAADQALYLAKDGGRNRVVAFSGPPPMVPTPSSPKRP